MMIINDDNDDNDVLGDSFTFRKKMRVSLVLQISSVVSFKY